MSWKKPKTGARKQLRLAVETEEERRARLENDAATKRLRLAMETEEERKARPEKMVATAQLMLALIKGLVDVGVVLSHTHSEKLATMLIIQTRCSNNIGTHNWKKYRSWIIVCFSHSSLYVPNNLYLIILIVSY